MASDIFTYPSSARESSFYLELYFFQITFPALDHGRGGTSPAGDVRAKAGNLERWSKTDSRGAECKYEDEATGGYGRYLDEH
jgi:hypothetical protein